MRLILTVTKRIKQIMIILTVIIFIFALSLFMAKVLNATGIPMQTASHIGYMFAGAFITLYGIRLGSRDG